MWLAVTGAMMMMMSAARAPVARPLHKTHSSTTTSTDDSALPSDTSARTSSTPAALSRAPAVSLAMPAVSLWLRDWSLMAGRDSALPDDDVDTNSAV